jgi:hypothetical protein
MPFIGKQPTTGFSTIVKDNLSPDGSTTAFTLSKGVASSNDIAVFVGNVRQEPTDAYSVSGTTLTMSAAPASGLNFYVLHIVGVKESSSVPADGTISSAKLTGNLTTPLNLTVGSALFVDTITDAAGTGTPNFPNGFTTGVAVTATTSIDATNTGSVTLDFAANQNFVLTLTGNVTLANPTTESVGQSGFIVFIQDGTGGRSVSLGSEYKTANAVGLTLSSAASSTDVVPYIVSASGSILLGAPQLAFA